MTQTSNRFYDQFAKLMNDAAGVAQGVRREAGNLFRGQAERLVADMDLVRREDFEAVREMAVRAREENERLQRRIDELEARLGGSTPAPVPPTGPSVGATTAARRSRSSGSKSGGAI